MIITVNVPDLWVCAVAEEATEYTYISDEQFVEELTSNGTVKVGYYVLGQLETGKVPLEEYINKTTDIDSSLGFFINNYGQLCIKEASADEIWNKKQYAPITASMVDYAVKSALINNIYSLTTEEAAQALKWLGAVGKEDYATASDAGIGKVLSDNGITLDSNKFFSIARATEVDIDVRQSYYKPIVARMLDYAVMKALTDSKNHSWSEEEKKLARQLFGVDYISENDEGGIIKVAKAHGFGISDGYLVHDTAKDDELNSKQGNMAVRVEQIDKAVRSGLAYTALEWTAAEKAAALQMLGALNIPSVLSQATSGSFVIVYNAALKETEIRSISQNAPGIAQVVVTTADGTVRTKNPINELDATNKAYVDALSDRIAVLERRDKKLYFTDYSFVDFGITDGVYTNTKEDDASVTTVFPTNMDGVRFNAKVSLGSEDAEVRLFGLRENGWQAPISLKIVSGELYAVDCVYQSDNSAGKYTTYLGNYTVGETFDISIELEALGPHMKAYFYINGEYVVSQVYYGYTGIFSRDIIIYARESSPITVTSV